MTTIANPKDGVSGAWGLDLLAVVRDLREEFYRTLNRQTAGMEPEVRAKFLAHPSIVAADAAIAKAEGHLDQPIPFRPTGKQP